MASNSSVAEGSAARKEPLHQMHIQKDGGLNPALARPSLREYLSSKENKAIMAVSAGNALEWYDFALFGFLAPELSQLFFPPMDSAVALMHTFLVFGGAFVVRPVGGVVMGMYSDMYGRKAALQLSLVVMAVATVMLGLLPTYDQVGSMATLLLVACRLAQGLSVGGQYSGAMVFLVESAPPGNDKLFGSICFASGNSGSMLGAAVVALFKSTGFMDKVTLMDYGWRYPFIASAGLGVAGYFLTAKAEESPHFKKGISSGNLAGLQDQARSSLPPPSIGQLLQEQGRRILAVTGVSVLAPAAFYTYYIFLPAFQSTMVTPTPYWNASSMTTFMLFISVLLMPIVGRSADTMGPGGAEWWMTRGAIALAVASPFLFIGLSSGNYFMSFGAHFLATVALCAYTGPLAAWLVKAFDPSSRGGALGLAWNISAAAIGGTTPALATYLVERTGWNIAPGLFVTAAACVSLSSLLLFGHIQVNSRSR